MNTIRPRELRGTTGSICPKSSLKRTQFPTNRTSGDFMITRNVRSTASMLQRRHITISSLVINEARRSLCAISDSRDLLQTISEWQGIGILNAECAVQPSSRNDAATAEVAKSKTLCLRSLSTDCIARTLKFFSRTTMRILGVWARVQGIVVQWTLNRCFGIVSRNYRKNLS